MLPSLWVSSGLPSNRQSISVLQKLRAAKREHAVFIINCMSGSCWPGELQPDLFDDAGHAGIAVEGPEDEADVDADALVVAVLTP